MVEKTVIVGKLGLPAAGDADELLVYIEIVVVTDDSEFVDFIAVGGFTALLGF